MKHRIAPLILTLIALPAAAHEGVQNAQVLARMTVMEGMAKEIKMLSGMVIGKIAFDADAAAKAKIKLERSAQEVLVSFQSQASDPHSEAAPAIWEEWDGFATKSVAMDAAIAAMDTSSLDTLKTGLGAVGQTCQACHKVYRIKK